MMTSDKCSILMGKDPYCGWVLLKLSPIPIPSSHELVIGGIEPKIMMFGLPVSELWDIFCPKMFSLLQCKYA